MSRRRRRDKRVKPDAVFRHGPIEVSRFGNTVLQRSNWGPGQHDEFMRRVPALAAEIRADVARAVSEMVDLMKQYDPLVFVQALFLSNNLVDPETYSEPTHSGVEARVEYAHSLAMAVEPPGTVEPPSLIIQRFIDLIRRVLDQMPLYFAIQSQHAKPLAERAFRMLTRFLLVRGSSHHAHENELIRRVFEPHDAWMKSAYGVTTADVLDGVELIEEQVLAHVRGTVLRGFQDLHALSEEFSSAEDPSAFMRCDATRARGEAAHRLLFDRSLDPIVLDASDEHLRALLPLIGAQLGENREFLTFAKSPGWPTNDSVITTKPLVLRDGKYLCPNVVFLIRQRFEVLLGLVRRDAGYFREVFCARRGRLLEDLSLEHLKRLLPNAEIHGSCYFRPNGPGTEPLLECDGLIAFDNYLFLVEAKSGDLSLSARRGSLERLERDLTALISKAHEQGLATKHHVENSVRPTFEDRSGRPLDPLQSGSAFRGIFIVTTTLADLSGIATHLNGLTPSGLVKGRDWPWCVFINDLRVISEVIESPAEFILYLERRLRLNDLGIFDAGDELDYFGYFLACGLHFEPEAKVGLGRFVPHGFTVPIDRYYDHLAGMVSSGDKPRFAINEELRALVQSIESSTIPDRTFVAKALLSFSGDAHRGIVENLRAICSKVMEDRGVHKYTLLCRESQPIVFACYPKGDLRTRPEIRNYALAKRAQLDVDKVISIEFEVDPISGARTFLGTEVIVQSGAVTPSVRAMAEDLRVAALARHIDQEGEPTRNNDCPCGSGDKYKRCCLEFVQSGQLNAARRARRARSSTSV